MNDEQTQQSFTVKITAISAEFLTGDKKIKVTSDQLEWAIAEAFIGLNILRDVAALAKVVSIVFEYGGADRYGDDLTSQKEQAFYQAAEELLEVWEESDKKLSEAVEKQKSNQ